MSAPKRPTLRQERALWAQGYSAIAGVDEVGRGPLAGPVVAAAVILPSRLRGPWVRLIRDSKLLTPRQRCQVAAALRESAVAIGIGAASLEEIERLNILGATLEAMRRALAALSPTPDFILIDALHLPGVAQPQRGLIHGDRLCRSIAAASIIAKVHRDGLMEELDGCYPGYGFARHKGYATAEHLAALRRLGPCAAHRLSFAPVRDLAQLALWPSGGQRDR
ncbi:MAG: ribonuclease HII [Dehalococcoidia bacterium]|nr:ribonuclease HII [Dehalococcoidia bacterium]